MLGRDMLLEVCCTDSLWLGFTWLQVSCHVVSAAVASHGQHQTHGVLSSLRHLLLTETQLASVSTLLQAPGAAAPLVA